MSQWIEWGGPVLGVGCTMPWLEAQIEPKRRERFPPFPPLGRGPSPPPAFDVKTPSPGLRTRGLSSRLGSQDSDPVLNTVPLVSVVLRLLHLGQATPPAVQGLQLLEAFSASLIA